MGQTGKCHLCGKQCELTFEHVPPKKAYNNKKVHLINRDIFINHIISGNKPWDLSGLRYKVSQRGLGGYTLCSQCNNNTGDWYANDYVNFVNAIWDVLAKSNDIEKVKEVKLKVMYPLRIIKQILCMFASTMHPEFLDAHTDLRKYIIKKKDRNFDIKKYRISMYILKEPNNGWSSLEAMLCSNGKIKIVAYMDIYPVGYILEIDPSDDEFNYVTNINNMATDFEYDFKGTLSVTLNILERNTFMCGDFRTKSEMKKHIK